MLPQQDLDRNLLKQNTEKNPESLFTLHLSTADPPSIPKF